MTIQVGEIIKCQNPDCGKEFRWIPRNSTIKPKFCLICHNKKLLERSNLNHNNKSTFKTGKYTTKKVNGLKRRKTPREKFYTSTAWKWFSKFILLSYSPNGISVKCSTCGTIKGLNNKEMHTGHWIKVFDSNSTNYSTAFEPTNLAPQCSKCNNYGGGRERLMQMFLENQHGKDELERLQVLAKQPFQLDSCTMKNISDEYRNKFNEILKQRGWKNPWKK